MNFKIMTVTSLNNYIKRILDNDIILMNTNVEGEISNLVHNRSGHLYFSLKDDASRIDCVMFKSDVMKMKEIPKDGDTVVIKGRISFYQRDGKCQLYVTEMNLKGMGDLLAQFNELKERLFKEGLFNIDIKKKIPLKPEKIAVITSPTGAAIRDIINVTRRRNQGQCLLVYPVKVQGEGSTEEVIDAIRKVNERADVDVIIIARGGGSIEDLWSFNSEKLAYAIRESNIPIVTGIGHEIDTTIADLSADMRAATPSQAAEITVPAIEDHFYALNEKKKRLNYLINEKLRLVQNILNMNQRLLNQKNPKYVLVNEAIRVNNYTSSMDKLLRMKSSEYKANIESLNIRLHGKNPKTTIEINLEKLKRIQNDISKILFNTLNSSKDKLNSQTDLLKANSPLNILNKGYSIIKDEKGNILSTVEAINENNTINIIVKNGNTIFKRN